MKAYRLNIFAYMCAAAILLACGSPALAQEGDEDSKSYSDIEKTQDKIEDLSVKIYEYYEDFPNFTYTYSYNEDGTLASVEVKGVGDKEDMTALQRDLEQLVELRNQIRNLANRIDVYYVTETVPRPAEGYEDFYDELYSEILYPEEALDQGLEGKVYVKFLVDDEGKILMAHADHTIESADYNDDLVKDMVDQAISAVESTSGEWTPGKIGGIPVTQWMMVPVEFEAKINPYLRPLYFDTNDSE